MRSNMSMYHHQRQPEVDTKGHTNGCRSITVAEKCVGIAMHTMSATGRRVGPTELYAYLT